MNRDIDLGRIRAVVIGASAGGVEALGGLLAALPARLVVPVFVVLHLAASRRSLLPSIFAAQCRRPVREAEDKEPIAGGTVYIAPPDYHLLVDAEDQLALSTEAPVLYSRPSIDVLFESAADVYGAGLLAILLTGASEDGTQGLLRVRSAGGATIVQDPVEAFATTMVEAAIARGAAERIMTLAGIATILGRLREARA